MATTTRRNRYAMSKAEAAKLTRLFTKYMEEVGAVVAPFPLHGGEWIVQTKAGPMRAALSLDYGPTLFCRFSDPDAGAKVAPCNPYTGKYNLHADKGKAADLIHHFIGHVACVMP